ncbi:hypothetical protein ACP275_03G127800 [Erythranthe tilingii]
MELKLSQSSLPTAIFTSSSPSSLQHFQQWKLEIERISRKGQGMISKESANHVVKDDRGETLTSISKLYGVSIIENCCLSAAAAAANKEMADVDLVSDGQNRNSARVCNLEGTELHENHQSSNATVSKQPNQMFYFLSSYQLPLVAKTAGSFLVLVPLMAFCISCIIGTFRNRVSRNSRHKASNKYGVQHHNKSHNSPRWKNVLDAESEPDNSHPLSEDQEQVNFEDASHANTKLEDDYQKFLSECGMSNWGYWRGGSPK